MLWEGRRATIGMAALTESGRSIRHISPYTEFCLRPIADARIIIGMRLESALEPGQSASVPLDEYRADLSSSGF